MDSFRDFGVKQLNILCINQVRSESESIVSVTIEEMVVKGDKQIVGEAANLGRF